MEAKPGNEQARPSRIAAAARARVRLGAAAVAATALALAWPAAAQSVVDGDSLELGGKIYRLHGIDAAESAQICADGWPAGYVAKEYLGELIEARQVVCVALASDRDGETVAICRADGVDLGAAMVTGGHALARVPYSVRYISQEDAAIAARRGVHAHNCVAPWKWRGRLGQAR